MLICLAHAYSLSEVVIRQENLSIMSCASYENTLQIYSFLSSSAQELADRYRRLDRTDLKDFCYLCTHETKRHIQRREFY